MRVSRAAEGGQRGAPQEGCRDTLHGKGRSRKSREEDIEARRMRGIETFRMTRSVSQISGIEAHRTGDVETSCMRRPVSQNL